MKIKFNGYYWTIIDILMVLVVVIGLIVFGVKLLSNAGVSLASVAGTIWGMGVLGFLFLYQLPIFGDSFEAQDLMDQKKQIYTKEEIKIIMDDRRHKKIEPKTLKWFVIFFCVSGGLALVGIFTNT